MRLKLAAREIADDLNLSALHLVPRIEAAQDFSIPHVAVLVFSFYITM